MVNGKPAASGTRGVLRPWVRGAGAITGIRIGDRSPRASLAFTGKTVLSGIYVRRAVDPVDDGKLSTTLYSRLDK